MKGKKDIHQLYHIRTDPRGFFKEYYDPVTGELIKKEPVAIAELEATADEDLVKRVLIFISGGCSLPQAFEELEVPSKVQKAIVRQKSFRKLFNEAVAVRSIHSQEAFYEKEVKRLDECSIMDSEEALDEKLEMLERKQKILERSWKKGEDGEIGPAKGNFLTINMGQNEVETAQFRPEINDEGTIVARKTEEKEEKFDAEGEVP